MKSSYVHMRITDDMKEQALKVAKSKNMTLSEYVRFLFIKEMGRIELEIEKEREAV